MPSSARSSLRSSVRRGAEVHQSLGLEDELSFGSDEDLMETIGEIDLPEGPEVPPLPDLASYDSPSGGKSNHKLRNKSTRSSRSLKKDSGRSKNSSDASLASSTHLLPPLPPVPSGSTLDLPAEMFGERTHKRGSIMGAFKVKGLRKWRDDSSTKGSFMTGTDTMSDTSTLSLAKIGSNTSSRPSFSSSLAAHTPHAPSPKAQNAHHAPLTLPSFESPNFSKAPLDNGAAYPARYADSTLSTASSGLTNSYTVPSSKERGSWTPSEISSAILPAFPATLSSLEPITVFSAQAAKRPPQSIMSGSGERGANGFRAVPSAAPRWTPCTLVFSLFKLSISANNRNGTGDEERSIAHVHIYSTQKSAAPALATNGIRRSKSNAGLSETTPRVEVERRALTRASTASVCDEYTDASGRAVVLRIAFGDDDRTKAGNEWLVEIKDSSMQEWIRQINKTAIMINAEELGYGKAIRSAYDQTAVSADELAHKLNAYVRSVEGQDRDKQGTVTRGVKIHDSPNSQTAERRNSVEAAQGAALARSRSADEPGSRNGSLGRSHQKSFSDSPSGQAGAAGVPGNINGVLDAPAPTAANGDANVRRKRENSIGSTDGLSFGAANLSLASALAFPAPPSNLPPPRAHGAGTSAAPRDGSQGLAFPAPPSDLPSSLGGGFPLPPSDLPPRHPRVSAAAALMPLTDAERAERAAHGTKTPPSATAPVVAQPPPVPEKVVEVESAAAIRPPTPPLRRSANNSPPGMSSPHTAVLNLVPRANDRGGASSVTSTNNSGSGTSVTSRLRRLRGKPQVIDIMSEFSAAEAESMPPPEDEEEPIREDRPTRIRFAEG